jgi:pimeloyl-ACP methyl ester carboxylesterase
MATTEHVRSADGTSIAFERHGDGRPTVVLVEPPLHHRGLSAFTGLVPLLAEQLTVVTYDRRGRGESDDTEPYHPDREVEDLDAVIRAVGGDAGLYGYSAGALLALRAASTSSCVLGLVLMEPPLHADGDPRPDPLTLELTELVTTDRAAAVRRFHEAIGVPEEYLTEMSLSPSWGSMIDAAHTLVYDCTISDTTDDELLARVTVPTLVLDSEGSTDDLTGWAATVADRLPAATSLSLPGQWHTVADDVLAPVIVDHLQALADGRQQ